MDFIFVKTLKPSSFVPFYVFFPSDLSNFFQKSGSITCLILWLSNFMQKIRKNWWANSTILRCEQQKQPPEVFCQKKSVLRNFAKFKGKQVCQRLFNKVAGLRPATLLKESLAQVFFCEFCEINKSTFFTKYLRETASGKNGQTDRKTHEQRQVHMTLPLVQVFKNYRHVKYSVTLLKNFLRGLFIVIS